MLAPAAMQQPDVDNRTDFVVHPQILLTKDGEKLLTVVKATYLLDPETGMLELAEQDEQRGVRPADVPWGEPETTPPMFPCDVVGPKGGTDVVIVASGHAPGGEPVPFFDVVAQIGPLSKTLRVFGLRVWAADGTDLSEPRPIAEQHIRYDAAWGGCDVTDPTRPVEEPRNPFGMGVVGDPEVLTHRAAPAIEDPIELISSIDTKPAPAGWGPLGPSFMPRRGYHGTYDEAWLRDQVPLPPLDSDDRANRCASPGMFADPALRGGEEVSLLNITPGGGAVAFALPTVRLRIDHEQRVPKQELKRERIAPVLDTVIIDTLFAPARNRVAVELVWRTLTHPPRSLKHATIVVREDRSRRAKTQGAA